MKELVQFALADLVVRGLVQEKIILRKTFEGSKGLSSSIVVIGVVPGAQANANMQTWDNEIDMICIFIINQQSINQGGNGAMVKAKQYIIS
ncbi:uncharacterized protein OCT59_003591 [Rhizophagus irregularis]|uniref:uncharacterized protein n=1 Tax=Rhizophagus irregularis TaxID=588596 RepID=UPI0019EB5F6C|nr:hypothetical protein OCT59_003591 [Rhizophagus irregularis]GBC37583.2 hypothetical protein RIR_jg29804.t1 [Rhizophagus irregularis DAOM 181602=DAOM 197198]